MREPFLGTVLLSAVLLAQDQGITGETHRKNLGRILWSKEPIQKDAQDRMPLTSTFVYGDPIYGRAFFPKSIAVMGKEKNCPNDQAEFRIKVFVDGKDAGWLHQHYLESTTWTTVQVTLNWVPGDEKDRMNLGLSERWAKVVEEMAPGAHKDSRGMVRPAGRHHLWPQAGGR